MSEGVNPSQGGMNPGSSPVVTNYFRGGATIAILALFLLLLTFSITNPLIPRIITIAIGVVGVATAFGLIPVRGPQDYYGGLALLIFGTFALIASAELPGQ